MSDKLKKFLLDVNLEGSVRERYKSDFDNLAKEYGLTDEEAKLVKDKRNPKSLQEIQKRVDGDYEVWNHPKDYVEVTTK